MTPGPLPVVRNDPNADIEEDCIICGESLSFSFRLPGEKPHIVPECGHALHEVCVRCVGVVVANWLVGVFYGCVWAGESVSDGGTSAQELGRVWSVSKADTSRRRGRGQVEQCAQ